MPTLPPRPPRPTPRGAEPLLLRIEGSDLPGRDCPAGGDFPGYRNIHVGVQRKDRPDELLDLQPGDAPAVHWELPCEPDGPSLKGRYIQKQKEARFVYLSWGEFDDAGFRMFRRAKLMLDGVPPDLMAAAQARGLLVARLGLTDPKGRPICASLRPPRVSWL